MGERQGYRAICTRSPGGPGGRRPSFPRPEPMAVIEPRTHSSRQQTLPTRRAGASWAVVLVLVVPAEGRGSGPSVSRGDPYMLCNGARAGPGEDSGRGEPTLSTIPNRVMAAEEAQACFYGG